ncbi:MAG: PIN domain-containing protein, partial [Treponema sp.]|nr:PIN domain-containing protein [Treponema sp.]
MRLLIDTNIVLDILLNRKPFVSNALTVLANDDFEKFVSASSITDIYYIAQQELKNKEYVCNLIRELLKIISVADVSESDIIHALDSNWSDFEDAVQNAVAHSYCVDIIITRNISDYKNSTIK